MVKPTNVNSDYREEERLTCVLVLDSFNVYLNEIVSHTSRPFCLWPVNGLPLIDYTIHTLVRSGIQEIILLAPSNSQEIHSYIMNSQWLHTYPKLIRLVPCKDARSLGDCLKDLEQDNIINNHFLLLYGNGILITNEKLNNLFNIHKENIKKDKNCIMTLVYRQLDSNHFQHPSYTDDQHLYIIRDFNTHRLYDYSKEYIEKYEIPLDLLEKPNVTVETLYCPLDCHLAVCSTDVLHLFKDNFDFFTINQFVKGVLRDEEIAGHTIYSYIYETGYFLSVHNLHLYTKAAFDILRRWSHPLVPEIMASIHKPTSLKVTTTSQSVPSVDSNSPFYKIIYPITYDKHNIYKQDDVQLDRLTNIQQDVFIGYKSQILSGVCLRSCLIGQNCIIGKNTKIFNSIIWNQVQIGENCIIQNSIICDNVLIRNNVQIDKECFLCKDVIIGTNIHLTNNKTLIATSLTTTKMTDDFEFDDDVQLAPENFKRSNSRQRRNSTRLSEKSFSDKSVSSIEEPVISNVDLVGSDGLGRELNSTKLNDNQTRTFEKIDDDDNEENDDKDRDELNSFDAWGHHIKTAETKDFSIEDEDEDMAHQRHRVSHIKVSTNQSSNVQSDEEISETTDDELNGSSSSDDNSIGNGVSEFLQEIIYTLERAYIDKLQLENILVEINMLKPTYDVTQVELDQSITSAVFLLPFEKRIINAEPSSNYWTRLKLTLDRISKFILKNYMRITNEQGQMTLLNQLNLICLKNIPSIGERIVNILNYLYENDVVDEKWILKWYEAKQEDIRNQKIIIKPEENIYYDKLKQFVDWLKTAESEEDDDDDAENE